MLCNDWIERCMVETRLAARELHWERETRQCGSSRLVCLQPQGLRGGCVMELGAESEAPLGFEFLAMSRWALAQERQQTWFSWGGNVRGCTWL